MITHHSEKVNYLEVEDKSESKDKLNNDDYRDGENEADGSDDNGDEKEDEGNDDDDDNSKSIQKPFKCSICSAGFVYEGYLKKHIDVHGMIFS